MNLGTRILNILFGIKPSFYEPTLKEKIYFLHLK
jgi:hypothetical protein